MGYLFGNKTVQRMTLILKYVGGCQIVLATSVAVLLSTRTLSPLDEFTDPRDHTISMLRVCLERGNSSECVFSGGIKAAADIIIQLILRTLLSSHFNGVIIKIQN